MPKFTKNYIDKLPFSDTQKLYWDVTQPGFGISVGSKSKTFIVQHVSRQLLCPVWRQL
jgi:hypothetical protein